MNEQTELLFSGIIITNKLYYIQNSSNIVRMTYIYVTMSNKLYYIPVQNNSFGGLVLGC